METDHLTYVYHAYRAGVIGGAAILRIDPSSMTRGIKAMEATLGYELFHHARGGKLEPRPICHEFVQRVAAPAVEGLAAYKAIDRGPGGVSLRIASTEFMMREYLAPVVGQLQKNLPGLGLEVEFGNRALLEQWLEEKKIDVALVLADEPSRKWTWQTMLEVTPVAVTLADADFTDFETALAANPIQHRLVCPPACEGIAKAMGRLLEQRRRHWNVSTVAGSTAMVPWLLTARDMVGISVAVRALERDGVVRHPLPLPPLLVGAMWRGTATPMLRDLIQLISTTAREMQRLMNARPKPPPPAAHVVR